MNIFSNLDNKELADFLDKTLNDYYDQVITKNLSININTFSINICRFSILDISYCLLNSVEFIFVATIV